MTDRRYRLPTPRRAPSEPAAPPAATRLPRPPKDELTVELRRPPKGGPVPLPRLPAPPDAATGERTAARAAQRDERRRSGSGIPRALRELAIVVVVALVLSFGIKTFVAESFWIPSGSMENTLVPGDRVVVSKLTPGPVALRRGDVVVFHDPGDWLDIPPVKRSGIGGAMVAGLRFIGLYPSGDNDLIKRVIGLPGDHVKCCNTRGQIEVNGVGLSEPYIYPGGGTDQKKFSVTVPSGRVWVMGDNRGDSADSRFHDDGSGRTGSVPESDIIGRAVMIVWPADRMSWLSNYSSTFDKVPQS